MKIFEFGSMKIDHKDVIVSVIAAAVIGVGYFVYQKYQANQAAADAITSTSDSTDNGLAYYVGDLYGYSDGGDGSAGSTGQSSASTPSAPSWSLPSAPILPTYNYVNPMAKSGGNITYSLPSLNSGAFGGTPTNFSSLVPQLV